MTPSFLIVNLSTHGSELRIYSYGLQYDHIMKAQKNVFFRYFYSRRRSIHKMHSEEVYTVFQNYANVLYLVVANIGIEWTYVYSRPLDFFPKSCPLWVFFMYWCLQTLNNKNGGNNQRSFWLRFRLQNETEIVNMSLSFRFILWLWYSGGHQGLLASCYQTIWVTNIHVIWVTNIHVTSLQ